MIFIDLSLKYLVSYRIWTLSPLENDLPSHDSLFLFGLDQNSPVYASKDSPVPRAQVNLAPGPRIVREKHDRQRLDEGIKTNHEGYEE